MQGVCSCPAAPARQGALLGPSSAALRLGKHNSLPVTVFCVPVLLCPMSFADNLNRWASRVDMVSGCGLRECVLSG